MEQLHVLDLFQGVATLVRGFEADPMMSLGRVLLIALGLLLIYLGRKGVLEALLMVSGNDAANALARAAGGVDATLAAMNATAEDIGAFDTVAGTPSGLDVGDPLRAARPACQCLRRA